LFTEAFGHLSEVDMAYGSAGSDEHRAWFGPEELEFFDGAAQRVIMAATSAYDDERTPASTTQLIQEMAFGRTPPLPRSKLQQVEAPPAMLSVSTTTMLVRMTNTWISRRGKTPVADLFTDIKKSLCSNWLRAA